MSAKDAHLYGQPRPKKTVVEKPNSATTAFGAAMSSMLTGKKPADKTHAKQPARPRDRDDIFCTHNKGAQKRAAADMLGLKKSGGQSGPALDEETWRRAKRKMDEKARLYSALKRGDVEDEAQKYGVDFDRKWADAEERGLSDQSDDEAESEDEADRAYMQEEVSFKDEFGRDRTMSRGEYIKRERDLKRAERASAALNAAGARPDAPTSVIYGDAIQHGAFKPDENVEQQMAELAAKRDREATPPPETHYDATEEIRTRGTGFYHFSRDESERKREMEELEARRRETDQARGGNVDAKEALRRKREAEAEARRQKIRDKKSRVQAERFPDSTRTEIAFARESKDKEET